LQRMFVNLGHISLVIPIGLMSPLESSTLVFDSDSRAIG